MFDSIEPKAESDDESFRRDYIIYCQLHRTNKVMRHREQLIEKRRQEIINFGHAIKVSLDNIKRIVTNQNLKNSIIEKPSSPEENQIELNRNSSLSNTTAATAKKKVIPVELNRLNAQRSRSITIKDPPKESRTIENSKSKKKHVQPSKINTKNSSQIKLSHPKPDKAKCTTAGTVNTQNLGNFKTWEKNNSPNSKLQTVNNDVKSNLQFNIMNPSELAYLIVKIRDFVFILSKIKSGIKLTKKKDKIMDTSNIYAIKFPSNPVMFRSNTSVPNEKNFESCMDTMQGNLISYSEVLEEPFPWTLVKFNGYNEFDTYNNFRLICPDVYSYYRLILKKEVFPQEIGDNIMDQTTKGN